ANEYGKTPVDSRANWGTYIAHFSLGPAGPDTPPPPLTLTAPHRGENWAAPSPPTHARAATANGGVRPLGIPSPTDGAAGTFVSIVSGLANSGSYVWTVPNTPTTNAFVQVVAHDAAGNTGADLSNAAFTISAPDTTAPTVTVTAPNGGENWAVGST